VGAGSGAGIIPKENLEERVLSPLLIPAAIIVLRAPLVPLHFTRGSLTSTSFWKALTLPHTAPKPQPAVDKWVIRMPNGTPLYKTAVPLLCYVELTQGGEAGERAFIGVQRSTEMHVARALPHRTYSSAFICLMSEAIKGR